MRTSVMIRTVSSLAVALIVAGTAPRGQALKVTESPTVLRSAGQFRSRALSQPPAVDGRAWIAARVEHTTDPGRVPLRTRAFALTTTACGDHNGDFVRCQLLFNREGAAPVRIHPGVTAWVFVTPDVRYIFTEPLYALDVQEWKQYALFDALQIPNYTTIEAISRDGRRLLISRTDCAMDCKDERVEYYELTLPQ